MRCAWEMVATVYAWLRPASLVFVTNTNQFGESGREFSRALEYYYYRQSISLDRMYVTGEEDTYILDQSDEKN